MKACPKLCALLSFFYVSHWNSSIKPDSCVFGSQCVWLYVSHWNSSIKPDSCVFGSQCVWLQESFLDVIFRVEELDDENRHWGAGKIHFPGFSDRYCWISSSSVNSGMAMSSILSTWLVGWVSSSSSISHSGMANF